MNLKYDSRVRGLLDKAEAQGFRLEHAGKCFKLYPPDKTKPILSISCTPSDCNFYWELRRMLKRCGFVETVVNAPKDERAPNAPPASKKGKSKS